MWERGLLCQVPLSLVLVHLFYLDLDLKNLILILQAMTQNARACTFAFAFSSAPSSFLPLLPAGVLVLFSFHFMFFSSIQKWQKNISRARARDGE